MTWVSLQLLLFLGVFASSPTVDTDDDSFGCLESEVITDPNSNSVWKMYLPGRIEWNQDCISFENVDIFLQSCDLPFQKEVYLQVPSQQKTIFWEPHQILPGDYKVILSTEDFDISSECFTIIIR